MIYLKSRQQRGQMTVEKQKTLTLRLELKEYQELQQRLLAYCNQNGATVPMTTYLRSLIFPEVK